MSASSRLRSFIASVKASPDTRRRTIALEREHEVLLAAIRALEAHMLNIDAAVDRMHQTLADADPQLALDIVTQVRDDVRTLLVDVTEQLNLDADAPRSTAVGSQEAPAPQG